MFHEEKYHSKLIFMKDKSPYKLHEEKYRDKLSLSWRRGEKLMYKSQEEKNQNGTSFMQ